MSEDDELWEHATSDVKPLDGKSTKKSEPNTSRKTQPKTPQIPKTQAPTLKSQDLDRRTNERLRKGQIPIDAQLDLHGLKQDQARESLINFVQNAYHSQKRCLLVITGKGQKNRDPLAPKIGILKQRVPEWLNEAPLNALILKTHTAQPKHGGDGALYILLRRQR